MLAAAKNDRRALAILVLLADSGCRRGELAAITRADVDLTSRVLHLRVSKSRARVVPLSDRAVVALGRWLRWRMRRQPRPASGRTRACGRSMIRRS
jgi:integrase